MKKIIVNLLLIISIISITLFLTSFAIIQEVKNLDLNLKVANHVGFNIDSDKVYFGTIPPNNNGIKRIIIENKEYEKSIVRLKVFGYLKNWISVSENNFVLKKGESKILELKATVPIDAEFMDYESKLVIIFTRF